MAGEPHGTDLDRFRADHPGWRVARGFEGRGWYAWLPASDERRETLPLVAQTLDELAAQIGFEQGRG